MQSPENADSIPITLTYDREGDVKLSPPKRAVVAVTPQLAETFVRAAAVNANDETPLSFTSLLTAMVSGSETVSLWLKAELERFGATAERIAGRRSRLYGPGASTADVVAPPAEYPTSVSARRAIEEAQRIAGDLESPATDVRHLAASYPVLQDWHARDFEELGIDRLAWCRALGAYMAKTFPDEKWYWRHYADRASPVPLTSFSADVYTDKDLLGIDRTVDALALLIASTRTDTPLSIGVFGEWGSGKSFFMRHLRNEIWKVTKREEPRIAAWREKRRQKTATSEAAPLYYGRIAQVEFNAWHYNEGNLVASLVDHLFRNLQVAPKCKPEELAQYQAAVLAQISAASVELTSASTAVDRARSEMEHARTRVVQATGEAESARKEVDALAATVATTQSDAERARGELDEAIKQMRLSKAVDAGAILDVAVAPVTESLAFRDARTAANVFANEVEDWRRFAASLFTRRGAAVVALCVSVPIAAGVVDWLSELQAAVGAMLVTAAASLKHVITFVQERRAEFERKWAALEEQETRRRRAQEQELQAKRAAVQKQWDDRVAALQSALDLEAARLSAREAALTSAAQALADRTKQLDEKVQERAAAEKHLLELEAQLQKLSSALLLDQFIKDRASSDDYRKQLGFMALVRRDFDRLSDLITEANKEWLSSTESDPPLLNRIVLYIDDLDRCKPETVIQVLEAVHLLLAFPLFVCVVAVDPRWIESCLKRKHSDLFTPKDTGGAVPVTVGDYLEKIFQIPIWMSPIAARQRSAVVKTLLGSTAAPPPAAAVTVGRDGEGGVERRDQERLGSHTGGDGGFDAAVKKAEDARDPLRITRDEAQFVDLVGPLLSDKPRALKRFVNTYRLLKASLPDIDRDGFVNDSAASPHRICISQLAFFTGQPRLAPLLAHHLVASNGGSVPLSEWMKGLPPEARASLEKALRLMPGCEVITVEEFRLWLPDTSKYLFHRQA